MPRRSDEEDDAAPPPPILTMPTKVSRNDGAGHANSDAEGIEDDSDPDVEIEFDESTGEKRNYTGYHTYRRIKECIKEQLHWLSHVSKYQIRHEIYTKVKKYMHASGLKKTPGNKTKETDKHLWKQCSKEYQNKRTCQWIRPFRCPMHYRCDCHAQVKLIT